MMQKLELSRHALLSKKPRLDPPLAPSRPPPRPIDGFERRPGWRSGDPSSCAPDLGARAESLQAALAPDRADGEAVVEALRQIAPADRPSLERRYGASGGALREEIQSRLDRYPAERALALLDGQDATATAIELDHAMAGVGTYEDALFESLERVPPRRMPEVAQAYRARTGEDLRAALIYDLEDPNQQARALALVEGDRDGADAARLRYAMAGMGTYEQDIEAVLANASPGRRRGIAQAYAERYGYGDLDALDRDLRAELSDAELEGMGLGLTAPLMLPRLRA